MKCHLLVTPYEHSRQENKAKEHRKEFESKELEAEREYQKKLEKLASEAPLFKDDDRL
jgi:hypothetical protein